MAGQLTIQIGADTSGFNSQMELATKNSKKFLDEAKKFGSTTGGITTATEKQANAFAKVVGELNKATDGTKTLKQEYKALGAAKEKLARQLSNLTAEQRKNSEIGRTLEATYQKVTKRYNEMAKIVKGSKKDLAGSFDPLAKLGKFDVSTIVGGLTKIIGPLGVATSGFEALKDVVHSNEIVMDNFGGKLEGVKNLWENLANEISRKGIKAFIELDFLTFFRMGKEKYNSKDAWESFLANNAALKAKMDAQITKSSATISDPDATEAEKKKAKADLKTAKDWIEKYKAEGEKLLDKLIKDTQQEIAGSNEAVKTFVKEFSESLNPNAYLSGKKAQYDLLKEEKDEFERVIESFEGKLQKLSGQSNPASTIPGAQALVYISDEEEKEYKKALAKRDEWEAKGLFTKFDNLEKFVTGETKLSGGSDSVVGRQAEKFTFSESLDATVKSANKLLTRVDKQLDTNAPNPKETKEPEIKLEREYFGADMAGVADSSVEFFERIINQLESLVDRTIGEEKAYYKDALAYFKSEAQREYPDEERFKPKASATPKTKGGKNESVEEYKRYSKEYTPLKTSSQAISGLGSLNNGLVSLADTFDRLNETENPFDAITQGINAFVQTAQYIEEIINIINTLGTSIQVLSELKHMETEKEIADNEKSSASNLTKAGSGFFSANSEIPIVGIIMAAAAVATMIATMIALKAKAKNAVKRADGGFIPGTSYTGDLVPAYLNSGELVLNANEQAVVRDLIGNSRSSQKIEVFGETRLSGKDIVIAFKNQERYNSRH